MTERSKGREHYALGDIHAYQDGDDIHGTRIAFEATGDVWEDLVSVIDDWVWPDWAFRDVIEFILESEDPDVSRSGVSAELVEPEFSEIAILFSAPRDEWERFYEHLLTYKDEAVHQFRTLIKSVLQLKPQVTLSPHIAAAD